MDSLAKERGIELATGDQNMLTSGATFTSSQVDLSTSDDPGDVHIQS
jgi:hypothetical protein